MSNKTGPKKSQAHRNSFAYSAALHSAAQKKIAALPASGLLCARCADIVRWRKQFGKYRPLSAPKKCVACQRKAVRDAYHVLCDACAAGARCAKCRAPAPLAAEVRRATDGGAAVVVSPSATAGKAEDAAAAKLRQARLLAACTERQRRSYRRKLDRGDPAEIARFEKKLQGGGGGGGGSGSDEEEEDDEEEDDGEEEDDCSDPESGSECGEGVAKAERR